MQRAAFLSPHAWRLAICHPGVAPVSALNIFSMTAVYAFAKWSYKAPSVRHDPLPEMTPCPRFTRSIGVERSLGTALAS